MKGSVAIPCIAKLCSGQRVELVESEYFTQHSIKKTAVGAAALKVL